MRDWWARHSEIAFRWILGLMGAIAVIWVAYEFWRLFFQMGLMGAVDLWNRWVETHRWFAGEFIYDSIITAVYPPATYAMLFPFVGWLEFTAARWLWAATTVAIMAWFAALLVRESGARTLYERVFVVLMLLATYPAGATTGNGQLSVHILPPLLTALLWLSRKRAAWDLDLAVAALLLAPLVKPSTAVPFFWIALFVSRRIRPVLLTSLGYLSLTLLAVSFQSAGFRAVIKGWLARSSHLASYTGPVYYANVHAWLSGLGLNEWILPASFLILIFLAYWIWRHRNAGVWPLIGVTAIVSRVWTYHRSYDDVLMMLPMVALFRIVKRGISADGADVTAALLLAVNVAMMVAPDALFVLPWPLNVVYTTIETAVWLLVLLFLADQSRSDAQKSV